MGWRNLLREWQARRAGRRHYGNDIARSARDVIGPTGWMWSNGWDEMERGSKAYIDSFNPRIPPSIFVSERERSRSNMPIPVVERCIEDWGRVELPDESPEVDFV